MEFDLLMRCVQHLYDVCLLDINLLIDKYGDKVKYIGFSGDIDNVYLNNMLKSMITDFFDNHLKNTENTDIDSSDWDEVKVISTK